MQQTLVSCKLHNLDLPTSPKYGMCLSWSGTSAPYSSHTELWPNWWISDIALCLIIKIIFILKLNLWSYNCSFEDWNYSFMVAFVLHNALYQYIMLNQENTDIEFSGRTLHPKPSGMFWMSRLNRRALRRNWILAFGTVIDAFAKWVVGAQCWLIISWGSWPKMHTVDSIWMLVRRT